MNLSSGALTLLIRTEPVRIGVVDVPVRTIGRRSTALLVKTDFSPPTPPIPPRLVADESVFWSTHAPDTYQAQLPLTNQCPTYLQPSYLGRRIRLAGFRRDSAKLKQAWLYARCSRISSPPTPLIRTCAHPHWGCGRPRPHHRPAKHGPCAPPRPMCLPVRMANSPPKKISK